MRRCIGVILLALATAPAMAAPTGAWEASQIPKWSMPTLAEAETFAGKHNVTALMVVQHGSVVADWGDTTKSTELASIRKSLLDALIGIAVSQHRLDLDNTMARLDIDDNPPSLSIEEKQATVRMLLEARSGVYHPALYETRAMAEKRPARFSHPPGAFWYYNNWDFNALGTIYEKATGQSIYRAFAEEIARPIGMQDYDPKAQHDVRGKASIHPAYTFRMSARDLARFALLFLDRGAWNERQIVPAQWVHDSTTAYSEADHGFGYGYLWWTAGAHDALHLPAGSYFAWGAGGQFAFIFPHDDLVIVERTDRDRRLTPPTLSDVAELLATIRRAGGLKY
jgi:CubicO group peptidase (beta-lactamase class C family)